MSAFPATQYKLIFFDLDGTLVDSCRDIANSVNYTLESLGFDKLPLEVISRSVGMGLENTIKEAVKNYNTDIDEAVMLFKDHYKQNSTHESSLYPGVREVLEKLSAITKVILTNKDDDVSTEILSHFGIRDFFSDIQGAGPDPDLKKPAPVNVFKILDKYSLGPNEAIIVGDMDIDIYCGRNSGTDTCAVSYGLGDKDKLRKASPDYMIDDISELPGIII